MMFLAQTSEIVEGLTKSTEGRSDVTFILVLVLVGLFGLIGLWLWKFSIPNKLAQTEIQRTQAQCLEKLSGTITTVDENTRVCVVNTDTLVAIEGPHRRALEKINSAVPDVELTEELGQLEAITEMHKQQRARP